MKKELMNIETLSKGAFKKMINLTSKKIYFDNGKNIKPCGVRASVNWTDEENVNNGFLMLKRITTLDPTHLQKISDILGNDTLGLVSIHFVKAVRGTKLEGKVASNIFVASGMSLSHSTKFAV